MANINWKGFDKFIAFLKGFAFIVGIAATITTIVFIQSNSEKNQIIKELQQQKAENKILLDSFQNRVVEQADQNKDLKAANEALKEQNATDKLNFAKREAALKAKYEAEKADILKRANGIIYEN